MQVREGAVATEGEQGMLREHCMKSGKETLDVVHRVPRFFIVGWLRNAHAVGH
jgi:hypothetical protein